MSYVILPDQAPDDVIEALRNAGIERPFMAGDPLDEAMPAASLRVVVQVGLEHLARMGGAKTGDFLTAEMANRGLLAFLHDREQRAMGRMTA